MISVSEPTVMAFLIGITIGIVGTKFLQEFFRMRKELKERKK